MGYGTSLLPGEKSPWINIKHIPLKAIVIIVAGVILLIGITLWGKARNCDDWWYWSSSQEAYDKDPIKYARLDANKNGIACELQKLDQHH